MPPRHPAPLPAVSAGFVELRGLALDTGTVVEVSARDGARLTVRLAPGSALDLAGLVGAFRGARA
jgi:hypothetical protein